MTIKLGIVMDPIDAIQYKKDSTLAMLLEAQQRDYQLHYMELTDLFIQQQQAYASTRPLSVTANPSDWFTLGESQISALSDLDVILMRKDPPFNMDYIYSTYILELAERTGTLIVNRPQSLRDANEKLFTTCFPQCTPVSLVTSQRKLIREFLAEHQDIILKPLDGMGGSGIFRIKRDDANTNAIIETVTQDENRLSMAQKYIPEISAGDKRILLIDGEAIPYALARIPAKGETRANLATGGQGVGLELSERDNWIVEQVAPTLREMGLIFVGLDVIGDYLTEINVTSPTGIRELDNQFNLNISATLMDCIENKLHSRQRI